MNENKENEWNATPKKEEMSKSEKAAPQRESKREDKEEQNIPNQQENLSQTYRQEGEQAPVGAENRFPDNEEQNNTYHYVSSEPAGQNAAASEADQRRRHSFAGGYTSQGNGYDQASASNPQQISPKKKNKELKIFLWVIGGLFGLLVAGFCAYGVYSAVINIQTGGSLFSMPNVPKIDELFGSESPQSETTESHNLADPNGPKLQTEDHPGGDEGQLSAEQVYAGASPSVVGIVIYDKNAGVGSDQKGEGSGIVLSEDGYIVTNSHVVGDSKQYGVKVVLSDKTEYAGTVVGYDTRTDLAVVKADAKGLTPAKFGNSDQTAVGAWVMAIGNPGGLDFAMSLTRGVVSAVNRSVGSTSNLVGYIQTDAAINPGNSGGPLLNMYGQVIGINTSKIVATGYEGMGFAIPINTAKSVIDDLISLGYVSGRVRLGMTGKVVGKYQAEIYGVPQGIMIQEIADDSDLGNQGIQAGDIITKVNGVDIDSFSVLYGELTKYKPGDEITLTVYRPKTDKIPASTFEKQVKVLEDKGQTQR